MVRHIDAIFTQGAFRPLLPLSLPDGARVHLRIEEQADAGVVTQAYNINSPRLARPESAKDFVMQVRETGDAGV
jgi:predicted DNA-binding antitoxin AbrB/MazE fold protein